MNKRDRRRWENGALQFARLQGCNCEPDIDIEEFGYGPNLHRAAIKHDNWCKLYQRLNAGSN